MPSSVGGRSARPPRTAPPPRPPPRSPQPRPLPPRHNPPDARRRELLAAALSSLPWWKAAKRPPGSDPILLLTPAERKELHDLEAEARAATLAQLGPGALDPDGNLAARYAFLPPEKAVLLSALERDYENLNSDLRETAGRVRTPADREQEQLLETERQRDLAALLSPAEREALALRSSPAAKRLASRMLAFQATEEEYRALYAIQQSFDEQFPASPRPTPGTLIPSLDSQPEFTKKIRDALGEARFADWETSSQMHVQALARLAVVNHLAPETVRDVTSILSATAATSWSIVNDHARPADQRTAALAQLAADTRGQITAKLGADTATKYLRDVVWFEPLANGTGVRLTPNGGLSLQGVSRPAAPTAPRD
ncbi:MAG: hypothetical protein NTV51_13840 [Verrucomicrobia bacterium]|nr:hypothetical protein [Verrucomicrobiota bacterium]